MGNCEICLSKVFNDKGVPIGNRSENMRQWRLFKECPSCQRAGLENYEMTTRTRKYLDLFGRCQNGMGGLNMSIGEWLNAPVDVYNAFGLIWGVKAGVDGTNT